MTNNELLSAIADMMNKNSKALEYRMDTMEKSLNDKIDRVEKVLNDKIDGVEQCLDNKIDNVECSLRGEIQKINLKLENDIEPRLQNIEACYISTYDRYKIEVERMDKMQMDIEVLQDVVREHGDAIAALTA